MYQQHVWAILVSREVVFGHQEVANRRDNSTQIDLICRLVLNLNMDPLTLNESLFLGSMLSFGAHIYKILGIYA